MTCKKIQIFDIGRSQDKWIHIFFLFSKMIFKKLNFSAYIFEFLILFLKKKYWWAQFVIFIEFLESIKYKVTCKKIQIFDIGMFQDKWINIFFLFSKMIFFLVDFLKIFSINLQKFQKFKNISPKIQFFKNHFRK